MDELLPVSKQNRPRLVSLGLDLDKTHFPDAAPRQRSPQHRPRHSSGASCPSVIIRPGPKVGSIASLSDCSAMTLCKEARDSFFAKLHVVRHRRAMELENKCCQVQADHRVLRHGCRPFCSVVMNHHPFWHIAMPAGLDGNHSIFHSPEVECKGKAAAPCEFGVKASIVTNNRRAPGGVFVLQARALPDNPGDGLTLRDVIHRDPHRLCDRRAYVDKGYRGHDAQNPIVSSYPARSAAPSESSSASCAAAPPSSLSSDTSRPKVTSAPATSKAVPGYTASVVLSAVGHNFRRILAWLSPLVP